MTDGSEGDIERARAWDRGGGRGPGQCESACDGHGRQIKTVPAAVLPEARGKHFSCDDVG